MTVDPKKLTSELETYCRQKGADLFGIADLGPADTFLSSCGDPIVKTYPRAVSMGMQINDAIVENHDPNEPRGKSLYWHHIYDVVSESLNFAAYDVSRWLADRGWDAFPVPASMPYNLKKLQGVISHKLAAHLAGVGWIGKSCLLLTREYGPRVRFVTVLTDAPITGPLTGGAAKDKKCGKCTACVDACPVNALAGVEFTPADDLAIRFDTARCSDYRVKHPCGRCVSACPIGERSKKRRQQGKAS